MAFTTPREGYPDDPDNVKRDEQQHSSDSGNSQPDASATDNNNNQSNAVPSEEQGISRVESKQSVKNRRRHQFRKGRFMIGLEPNQRIKQHHPGAEHLFWSRVRSVMQEPFSEFLGVLVFAMIQQGGLAQATLGASETTAPGGDGFGSFLTVPFTTGIGVLLGVYIAGDSGSYLNPAITFANCLFRGLPWRTFPLLTLAQLLAVFCATGITYAIYLPDMNEFSGGALLAPPSDQATAAIFTTFPQTFSSITSQVPTTNFPLNLFFLFFGLTAALGWQTGGQVNPALDFGGRIMLSVVGYPATIWSGPDATPGYPWIPIICPFIGSTFGAWLYDVFVFTGSTPVNTPWLGLQKIFKPVDDVENRRRRYEQRRDSEQGIP